MVITEEVHREYSEAMERVLEQYNLRYIKQGDGPIVKYSIVINSETTPFELGIQFASQLGLMQEQGQNYRSHDELEEMDIKCPVCNNKQEIHLRGDINYGYYTCGKCGSHFDSHDQIINFRKQKEKPKKKWWQIFT